MESDSGEPSFIHHVTPHLMAINILDNPVWHALTGPYGVHACGHGRARRYPRDFAPLSAIGEASDRHMPTSRSIPAGTEARLFRPDVEPLSDGWEEIGCFPMLEMVASRAPMINRLTG